MFTVVKSVRYHGTTAISRYLWNTPICAPSRFGLNLRVLTSSRVLNPYQVLNSNSPHQCHIGSIRSISSTRVPYNPSAAAKQVDDSKGHNTREQIINVKIEGNLKEAVEVEWSSGVIHQFPYLWLRDHCPTNFQAASPTHKFRTIKMYELDPNSVPKDVKVRSRACLSVCLSFCLRLTSSGQLICMSWIRTMHLKMSR